MFQAGNLAAALRSGALRSLFTPADARKAGAPVPKRPVTCFDCGAAQKVSRAAASTQCRACGTFIDLRDLQVRTWLTERIRTRGNVTVHKKGALLGTVVYCGSLLLHGKVSGSVHAQETVEIATDCNIIGEIRCRRLIIARKCVVRCRQPVHAEEIVVRGTLSGAVNVSGRSIIEERGVFEGTLSTGVLNLRTGGTLNGEVEVNGIPPTAERRLHEEQPRLRGEGAAEFQRNDS